MTVSVRAREPAVDAEVEVKPAYLPERETWRFRIYSRELHQWLEGRIPPQKSPFVRRFEFVANCTETEEGPSHSMLRTPYTVQVKELRYPGGPRDVEDPVGKWAYAFRGGKLVAEATCVEGDVWDNWAAQGALRRPGGTARGMQLDPGPAGKRYKYSYLLSPVKLPQKVLDGIDQAKLDAAAVACDCSRYDKTVYVPDPLRWACEVNERFYRPRLTTLNAWLTDEGLLAYELVARVLKAWMDTGDKAGITNNLERKPADWLKAREDGTTQALKAAEDAAAYLAHCVTSVEYQAVEQACLAQGAEELELAAVCLATALRGVLQTGAGSELAGHLLGDAQRLPKKVIFQDDRPVLSDEAFARHRFGQRALLGIFIELYPAWIELATRETVRLAKEELARETADLKVVNGLIAKAEKRASRASPKYEASLKKKAQVVRYLENVGVKTKTRSRQHMSKQQKARLKDQERILTNLTANRKITTGLETRSARAKRVLEEWDRLVDLEEVKVAAPPSPTPDKLRAMEHERRIAKAEETLDGVERLGKKYARFEEFAKKLALTAGTAVELVNVMNAIRELAGALEEDKEVGKKVASLTGSLADLVEHGVGVPEMLGVELSATTMKWMKGVGGVAGVIGGTIDALDYGFQTYEAVDEYDYGKAVGRGMQTAGATASVCGSVLGLIAAFGEAGSVVGPAGTLAGVAGGALVATGHMVSKWLQLNANETFTARSFLGDCHANKDKEMPWSEQRLPVDIPTKEALVLFDLLAQFRVSGTAPDGGWGDWTIELMPGYYEGGSRFEVDIVNSWDNEAAQARLRAAPTSGEPGCHPELMLPEPVHARVVVDLEQGEVRQLDGPRLKAGMVWLDDEGRVERVLINLEEERIKSTPEEEAPLDLDDVARVLAGPLSRNLLRTNAHRVTRVKVRLVRPVKGDPPFRYVPSKEGHAMQVMLPMEGPMTSLDVKEGELMDIWKVSPGSTEEVD